MSVETTADLTPAEVTVLEALEKGEPTASRRVDVADRVDVDYPEAELALKQRGLVEDAGEELVRTDDGRLKHQLVALTERGRRALADAQTPEPDPEPVEPEELPERSSPWLDDDDWRTLSEDVERILDEAVGVEYDETADVVRIELERDGTRAEITLTLAAWHNTGRPSFYDGYRGAFGDPPGLDDREWGVLQARLVDRFGSSSGERS
jgi:antitoxin (DNA-binding transcriptional repressor) of toxin-antitoxin stability system